MNISFRLHRKLIFVAKGSRKTPFCSNDLLLGQMGVQRATPFGKISELVSGGRLPVICHILYGRAEYYETLEV